MPVNIPLTETFTETDWSRYVIPVAATTTSALGREPSSNYLWGLNTLEHVDIRTFNNSNVIGVAEGWTATPSVSFSTGIQSSVNNWMALVATLSTGTTTFTSTGRPLDLSLIPSATVSLGLPSFPVSNINLSQSGITLIDGSGNSSTVFFSTSITPLTSSTEASWSISSFTGIDLTDVVTVKIVLVATSGCTFKACALRLIGPNWVQPSVDFDNWNGILKQSPSVDGSYDEPVQNAQTIPQVWYAASSGGSDDPRPIDGKFSVIFYTGANTGTNQFSINMRGVGGTETSQLLLETMVQSQLNGPQPGLIGTAEIPRKMSDFQGLTMGQMAQSMFNLEAVSENVSQTWVSFLIQWGGQPFMQISDSLEINPYVWSGTHFITLSASTFYQVVFSLQENTVRGQIYSINQTTFAPNGDPIFDTGEVTDTYQFIRRPGIIGWEANFTDGASFVKSLLPAGLTFAKYQSLPLNSNSPVIGAELFADFSSDIELWRGFSGYPVNSPPLLRQDPGRTITNASTRVDAQTGQGVISNLLTNGIDGITDMDNTYVKFSIWLSSFIPPSDLEILLINQFGSTITLTPPNLIYGQWQEILFDLDSTMPPGFYQLVIRYLGASPMTFWVDGESVAQRAVVWDARASSLDPWVPFKDVINQPSGVVLNRGTALEVRARARRQDAMIFAAPKIVPNYAKPGKFLWPEDIQSLTAGPINSSFSTTLISGRKYTLAAADPTAYIIGYIWSISDGTILNGAVTNHQFPALATSNTAYNVTLTVMDVYGNLSSTTQEVLIP